MRDVPLPNVMPRRLDLSTGWDFRGAEDRLLIGVEVATDVQTPLAIDAQEAREVAAITQPVIEPQMQGRERSRALLRSFGRCPRIFGGSIHLRSSA